MLVLALEKRSAGRQRAVVMVEIRSAAELKSATACSKGSALTVSAHIVSAVRMSLLMLANASVLKRTLRAGIRRAYHTTHSR